MDRITEVDVEELAVAARDGAPVIDVREPWEYESGHVPGATLLPLGSLPSLASELPRSRRLYVICASGNRSAVAAEALVRAGFDAVSVAGGTSAWQQRGNPVVVGAHAA